MVSGRNRLISREFEHTKAAFRGWWTMRSWSRRVRAFSTPTASGEWVFPGDKGYGPLSTDDLWRFWIKARDAAGIVADARLHDLRHAHASHAVMNGEGLHVAGRLLGHRRATTTNRYVHLDDATLSKAAERVAVAIELRLQYSNPDLKRIVE